jgi:hypothetical protein
MYTSLVIDKSDLNLITDDIQLNLCITNIFHTQTFVWNKQVFVLKRLNLQRLIILGII